MNRYCELDAASRTLRETTAAYAADRSEANASAARTSFVTAMAVLQEAVLFQFGPAARGSEPGGADHMDQIYGWPATDRCAIEQQVVSKGYTQSNFGSSLITHRTLGAADYLLFYTGTDNACTQFSVINANGSWAALSAEELAARKAAYAAAVASDVHEHAGALYTAWLPSGGDFRAQFVQAGSGSNVFPDIQDALTALTHALFYIEDVTKDEKLGRPLGYPIDCVTPTCPESVESKYALLSTPHLRANLRGFRRLFQGCAPNNAGIGFDDWLVAIGQDALATEMLARLTAAEAAVDGLNPPIEQAIYEQPPAKVQAVYNALKAFNDLLKTTFMTTLGIDLPPSVGDDND